MKVYVETIHIFSLHTMGDYCKSLATEEKFGH